MTDFELGATYSGFVLNRVETIAELDSTVLLFTHARLGTPALAIKNIDPNKTFCAAFQTLPEDSTGVAHILEHSVLMGSEKYPVKDVFGEIHKGGLMTFLNAMTGGDTTFYPFATRNLQEYFNIMDVYCDVVFHPLLLPTTFEQEGWHYHKEGPDQPLEFQGVVFNEMKGAFSDPIRALFHHTFGGLMPGSTYAHESGGDPRNIPDLTFARFVDFHRRFYHPSNGMLFFYGDADLAAELAFVQDRFLAGYDAPAARDQINLGEIIRQPVLIEDTYGVQKGADLSGKTFLSVGSTIGTVLELELNTAFQIIAQILYNSDASPLKKAILEAGLCKDFGGLFLANSSFTTIMMTYLIGSEASHLDGFREVYRRTLGQMVTDGLDRDLVLSELNKYEFSVREDMTKAQRGLDLISKALPAVMHGADPFAAMCNDELFRTIRTKALSERYFEQLISAHLLDNPSTVEIILRPDQDKNALMNQEEQQRLADYENSLNADEREKIVRRTRELVQLQQMPNDAETLNLLPRLRIKDLDPRPAYHQVQVAELAGRQLLVNELPTNGIVYMDFGLDCAMLPPRLLPLLDLFGTIVTEIGTDSKDYMQFARELGMYTGGFSNSFNTYTRLGDTSEGCRPMAWFHLKALSTFLDRALSLAGEIFCGVSFANRQRIREIVLREFAWAEHSVQSEGYSLAASRVFAHLSQAGQYNEYVNGATSYLHLKELARDYDRREDDFLRALEELRDLLFRRKALLLSITGGASDISAFQQQAETVVACLAAGEVSPVAPEFTPFAPNQGLCTSAEVVYNVQGCRIFADPGQYNGQFEVLKTWISRDYLWNTVRQMGGAYGCFVQFNHLTGNFGLVSYRDPHISRTYAAYDDLGRHIRDLDLSPQVMEQLILGTYGSLDPLQAPAAKGATARNDFLSGVTVDFKQQRVEQALAATVADLRSFASCFENLSKSGFRATIGNGDKIRGARELFSELVDL
ncbi:MAG TPA: peptidase M16 [Desulfobulbaceae bacterium]|nr:peptidase M16 [Desulfobulbaceae bacterium]